MDYYKNFKWEIQNTFGEDWGQGIAFYNKWIWPIIANFIPILILAVCNTRLVWELKKATNARKRTARGQTVRDTSRNINLTLIIIVLMLLFLVSPCEIIRYINPYKTWGEDGHIVAAVANILQAINFAFNFILYCILSAAFRQTVRAMFTCCYSDKTERIELESMLTSEQPNTDKTNVTNTEVLD